MRITRKQFLGASLVAGFGVGGGVAWNWAHSVRRLSDEELIKGLFADQANMILCYDELIRRGADAFVALVAHSKDPTVTCGCIEGDRRTRQATVGQLCTRALLGEVRPWPSFIYDFHYRPERVHGSDWSAIPWVSDQVAAWYDDRKDYTLHQFQSECVQKTIGLIKSTKSFYGGSGKRKEYLAGLNWCAEYLTLTRAAISVHATWYYEECQRALAAGDIQPDMTVSNSVTRSIGKPPFAVFDGETIRGRGSMYK